MTVQDWIQASSFEVLCGEEFAGQREIGGGYCGDLLSWVLTHANENDAWMTVTGHVNAVAVAVQIKAACLVLTDGVVPEESAVKRAEENELVVLRTQRSAFHTAAELSALLQKQRRKEK